MRIIDDWKSKFPQTVNFLNSDLPQLEQSAPGIWKAFVSVTGLTDAEAKQAVTIGVDAPLLWFLPLGLSSGGYFNASVPGRISLSGDIAPIFEANAGNATAQQFLRLVTLHELCHWALCRRQEPEAGDAGDKFENAAQAHPDYSWIRAAPVVAAGAPSANQPNRNASGAPVPAVGPVNGSALDARIKSLKETLITGKLAQPSLDLFDGSDVAQGMPRGIRNNNPGNIRVGENWLGLAERSHMTDFQKQESNFCVFSEPEWGLRAIARILRNYQSEHNLKTPLDIIARWAPASDNNDVTSYANAVSAALGISAAASVDLTDDVKMLLTIKAIAKHENGQTPPYADLQYRAALELLPADVI